MRKSKISMIIIACMVLVCAIVAGCTVTPATSNPSVDTSAVATEPAGPVVWYLLTEETKYDSKGNLWSQTAYSYDEQGRVTSKQFHAYDVDGTCYEEYLCSYTYNEQGYLSCYAYEGTFPHENRYTYTYNEDGTVASYSTGEDFTRYFVYDPQGRLVEVKNNDGSKYHQTLTYDQHGRLVQIMDEFLGIQVASFSYDDKGRLIEGNYIKYQYDAAGNLTGISGNMADAAWTFHYESGVLNGVQCKPQSGDEMEREYVLDEKGNVSEILWGNGVRTVFRYQTIELSSEENQIFSYPWDLVNQEKTIAAYHNNILQWFLPSFDPDHPY